MTRKGQLPQDRKKTQMGDILDQTERVHNERYIQQRAIEKNQEETRANHSWTHLPPRCGRRSISTMLLNPNQKWMERKKSHYLTSVILTE
jgi:hypothetical protein